jgi:hypothetical protein
VQKATFDFYCRCATSFLFTQRRAVVFSADKTKHDEVNAIIRVLAALCADEQLQYSSLLVPEQRFIPDMYLQGLDDIPLPDDLFECATTSLRQWQLTFPYFSGVRTWLLLSTCRRRK